MVTVFVVMPDKKVVLNVPISVAVCGGIVIGLFPLPEIVYPPPTPLAEAFELVLMELVVDNPGITMPS